MQVLVGDPGSQTAASVQGWEHSASREVLALYDLFDLTHAANSKRSPKPHPGRPKSPAKRLGERMGKVGNRNPDSVRNLLAEWRDGRPPI